MSFVLRDIDLCDPIEDLSIPDDRTGLGLLLRYRRRPIAFDMVPFAPGSVLSGDEVRQIVARLAGRKLLQEKLRDELSASIEAVRPESLSVAVCTKDRPQMLARCLDALCRTRRMDGAGLSELLSLEPQRYEILVVDNAPSDNRTQTLAEQFPRIRYLREPLPGLDFARNRAIAEARGEFVAFVDDDVVVDEWWLEGLYEALRSNPDASGVTGLILPYALDTQAQILFESRGGFGRGYEPIRFGQVLPGNPLYPCGAGIFGAGANMAFRRDLLVSLGGFDEALDTGAPLPGGGDLDIFYRVIRSGHTLVYEPRFAAFHEHRRDLASLLRQYRSWGRGFAAYFTKSYRTDGQQRGQFRRLAAWWCGYQLRQVFGSLMSGDLISARLVLAELAGGVVGILGAYDRSRRRIAELRSQAP